MKHSISKLPGMVAAIMLLFSGQVLQAQHEADNWYYGWGVGVNFAGGDPVLLNHFIPMWTFYGSTSLSDSLGNLLFYSSGIEVYNRNDAVMPNGSGLLADELAPNPCIAFPKPGDPANYYLFTVGGGSGSNKRTGSEYSLIDMNLAFGLGDIVAGRKNIPLIAADSAYQTISAVKHGSRDAYWVVIRNHRNPNKFLSFLVDESGVNQNPVVSPCILNFLTGSNQSEIVKISADGKFVLFAARNVTGGHYGEVELYHFNSLTGQLTPALLFNSGGNNCGAEFSPNSELLYMSNNRFLPVINQSESWISQYDMSKLSDLAQFEASRIRLMVDTSAFSWLGNMLLANNGKIYFNQPEYIGSSGYGYLSVINHPSVKGFGCNLQQKVLETFDQCEGLPTFVSSFMAGFEWKGSCAGDTIQFRSRFNPTPVSYAWNFDDPASGPANTSTEKNPVHSFASGGSYNVSVTVVFQNGTQQSSNQLVTVFPPPLVELGDTIRKCSGQEITLSPGNGYASYRWSDGSQGPLLTVTGPGSYWVEVTNDGGCRAADTVIVSDYPAIALIEDQLNISPTTCGGSSGAITGLQFGGVPPYQLEWKDVVSGNTISALPDVYNLPVGLYRISLTDASGCAMEPATYEIRDVGDLLIDTVTFTQSSCSANDAVIDIVAVSGLGSRIHYFLKHENDTLDQWHSGLFAGIGPGTYFAWATDSTACTCFYNRPVVISTPDGPVITQQIVLPATGSEADGSIILAATSQSGGDLFYTVNGSTHINNGSFDHLPAGTYSCVVTDQNGCSTALSLIIPSLEVTYLQAVAGHDAACMNHTARTPLFLSKFSNISSFTTTLIYNASMLECIGYTNVNDSLAGQIEPLAYPSAGKVRIGWNRVNPLTLPDSAVMLNLLFRANAGGSSPLEWDMAPGVNHFYDNHGLEIQVYYTMGTIVFSNPPFVEVNDQQGCEGENLVYVPVISGGTGELGYEWRSEAGIAGNQPALEFDALSPGDAGSYSLRVYDALDCADTATVTLTVIPLPQPGFTADTLWFEDNFRLELPAGYAAYLWNTGDTTSFLTGNSAGVYTVRITGSGGCTSVDSVTLMRSSVHLRMPDAFTPDGDGLNDLFRPLMAGDAIREISLMVYDRWGTLISQTSGPGCSWDGNCLGKACSAGMYAWVLVYRTMRDSLERQSGFVMLLR